MPNGYSYNITEVLREVRDNPQLWTTIRPQFESFEEFARFQMQILSFGGQTQIAKTMSRIEKKIDDQNEKSQKILTQARMSAQTSSANLQMNVKDRIAQKKSPLKVGKVSAANVFVRRSLNRAGLTSGYATKDPLNVTVYTLSDEENDDEEDDENRCANPDCPHEQKEPEDDDQELLVDNSRKRKHDHQQGPGAGGAGSAIAT